MPFKNFGERVAASVDDVRDRAADIVSTDETPEYRELGRVRRRLDEVEADLSGSLAALADEQDRRWDALDKRARKTTWPRRLFWLLLGAAAGAIGLMVSDPTRQ